MMRNLFIFLMLACCGHVVANPARVAIIADEASQPVADLLTKELSAREGINLMERADLSKIGDEAKLQKMAAQDSVAAGKLLGADGLIFLRIDPQGVQARFTAVKLGYALFDDKAAAGGNMERLAKELAHKVEGYVSKLDLDPVRAIPVSVLNLRADYAVKGSADVERKLTLLLESRLAAVPEYVVLERRHAWDVGFERSASDVSQPLLKGAFVIDGTLTLPGETGGEMMVMLRLRASDGHETPLEIRGAMNDLPGLVEKMSAKIREATGGAGAAQWTPQKEAREYLLEGIWGWQHNANASALEALDSAELLGENIADVEAVRLFVLGKSINEGLENWYPKVSALDRPPATDAAGLSQKMALAMRAIPELIRYRDEKMESGLRAFPKDIPVAAVTFKTQYEEELVVYPLSKLLVLLDAAGDARADELRAAIRPITQYDPLHGKMGLRMSTRMNNGVMSEVFADDWAQTLDEELAYYRLMCSAENYYLPYDLTYWREERFCPRFAKDADGRKRIFDKFVENLKEVPAARLPYLILVAGSHDETVSDAAFKACLDAMWEKRDALVSPRFHAEWGNLGAIHDDVMKRNYQAMLPLLHYLLTHAEDSVHSRAALNLMWRYREWTEEEAGAVWKDFLAYKVRTNAGETQYEKEFLGKFPQLAGAAPAPEEPKEPSLVVGRYWHPWLSPSWAEDYFWFAIMDTDDEGLWISSDDHFHHPSIFRVRLPGFDTQTIPIPKGHTLEKLVRDRDALFATWQTHGNDNSGARQIARYDLKKEMWDVHDLPDCRACQPFNVEGTLYLVLTFMSGETAVARYDWDTGKIFILSSSRRKPAQNQFDDRPDNLSHIRVFAGPGHKPCIASPADGVFYIRETPGKWEGVFSGAFNDFSFTAVDRTLVINYTEATLIDPKLDAPVYLAASSEPRFRNRGSPGTPPVKEAPPWTGQAMWNVPSLGFPQGTQIKAAWDDDGLYLLVNPKIKGGPYDLVCYEKGKGKLPRHVPLEFHLDEATHAVLSVARPITPVTWKLSQVEHPDTTIYPGDVTQVFCTKQGLCVTQGMLGFWFLPYVDIKGYLAASAKNSSHQ